jgi:hypothetical protein
VGRGWVIVLSVGMDDLLGVELEVGGKCAGVGRGYDVGCGYGCPCWMWMGVGQVVVWGVELEVGQVIVWGVVWDNKLGVRWVSDMGVLQEIIFLEDL